MAIGSYTFNDLKDGCTVAGEEGIIPAVSAYKLGGVAPVFPNEEAGTKFIEEHGEELATLQSGIHLSPVMDPWLFMRRAGGEGLCGLIMLGDNVGPSTSFMFMTRVEETGNDLPTVLAVSDEGILGPCLTRVGERRFDHSELVHWSRFDLTDPITAKWGVKAPFRDWKPGSQFYELRDENWLLRISHHPLLGDWINIDGGFAIFIDEEDAWHYLHQHASTSNNRVDFIGDVEVASGEPPQANIRPWPVNDLATRVNELTQHNPFASICVDPDGHRENMGYIRDDELITVSGRWKIQPSNQFERIDHYKGWQGRDTIGWSGGQEIQLVPLARSFEDPSGKYSKAQVADMTLNEAEDWIHAFLEGYESHTITEGIGNGVPNELNNYYLVCWDTVTGESEFSPIGQTSFIDMIGWLTEFEKEDDRPFRVTGASSCSGGIIGFEGSNDEDLEESTGNHFNIGLARLGTNVLSHGYTPADSNKLVALCNENLKTLHVEFAGYAKDLIWAVNDQQLPNVIERLGLEESQCDRWRLSTEAYIDPIGQEAGITRMGEASWELLSENSKHFLSTALATLDELGHIPQRDYAPISLEIVKALEVELSLICSAYRDTLSGADLDYDSSKFAENALRDYLSGKRAPTIGAVAYLFKPASPTQSPLQLSLSTFLATLRNHDFLTSNRFTKRALQRVINKYRNGGAHETPIKYDVCLQCVDEIVGTDVNQGIIAQVLEWKAFYVKKPGKLNH